ncbi:hypothetical protein [Lentilactobacillus kisonensis]|uniref:Uncharacterized protein n=1 Tax=Lentilactobacillus kisonensis F0435 TaxID=797516 RepID=H1LL63_9LACO|nr:hypothetical protein [Lentilactobacillus kisonensis]EHO45197.1 hypothetical protein HMPREF9104_03371 [Lentilactobacillus kisonensis F0435]
MMLKINLKKVAMILVSSLALILFFTSTTANASSKTYRDRRDNATVTVHKRGSKVTSVVYQLKNPSKYKKHYQKRSKFYTKVAVLSSKTATLFRKNYKGTVTFNRKMSYYESKNYASEQTNPVRGMISDATDAIFMNVSYFGKNPSKYHNALFLFGYWWNTMDEAPKGNPEGNAVVLKNGKVLFSDSFYEKLPD